MPRAVISVENLSKAYRIGLKEEIPDTLAGAFTGFLKSPFRNLRQLSRLDTFRHQADSEDIFWALKDVSFEVQEGEVLGVIGRNGAGKSTLLKILSRITEPTSGRAVIRGRVSSLLEVGTGFHPELSGRENVYLNGTILGMTKAEIDRKFDEIVDFSGVEKFLDTPIKRYSSGMKVRLAFAVAAHLEPEILIIDEVLAVGDAEFQKKCLGKMQDVASHGRTVLFVSHNMAAVECLCTTGLYLTSGEIKAHGDATTAISSYSHSSPAALLNTSTDIEGSDFLCKLSLHSHRTGSLTTGSDLEIAITTRDIATPRRIELGIGIDSHNGTKLATLSTRFNNFSPLLHGRQTIKCHLPDLPLAPGTYAISLGYDDSTGARERLQDVVKFEIEASDFFKTGHIPSQSTNGYFVLTPQWGLNDIRSL